MELVSKSKLTFFLALLGISIVVVLFYAKLLEPCPFTCGDCFVKPSPKNIIKDDLVIIAKLIHDANIHVRGVRTSGKLKEAVMRFKDMFESLGLDYEKVTKRKTYNSNNICPEVYVNTRLGYPRYHKGFVYNCSYARQINSLITVLFNINILTSNVSVLLDSIQNNLNGVNTIINIKQTVSVPISSNVIILHEDGNIGQIWNKMLTRVNTPFVLFARDVYWINYDARLERLIHQVDSLGLDAVGGSYRNLAGNWFIGCQQSVLQNHSLVYEAGYDESIQECEICDHIDGPFVTRTEVAKKIKFSENIFGEGLFEDFFLRLRKNSEMAVCPDSMFFTDKKERSYINKDWTSFARKWDVNLIKFSGKEIKIECSDRYDCKPIKNGAYSPCCLQELALLLTRVLDACQKKKIQAEAFSGSSIGAIKFNGILPWEVDADILCSKTNASIMKTLGSELEKYGYRFNKQSTPDDYVVYSKHWFLEIWVNTLDPIHDVVSIPINQTTVNIDGKWIPTARNPANYTRNRYGHEILQHAQSWRATNDKSSWITYKTNTFLKCGVPGHHTCLDSYNGDGSFQFRDPIP